MNISYLSKSINSNNSLKTRQNQNNSGLKLSFRANAAFEKMAEGFETTILPEEKKDLLKQLLELASKYNSNLINNLRKRLGFKSSTNFDWNKNLYSLDLSEHTVEEFAGSLLEHILSNMQGIQIHKSEGMRKSNVYNWNINKLHIKFNTEQKSGSLPHKYLLHISDKERYSQQEEEKFNPILSLFMNDDASGVVISAGNINIKDQGLKELIEQIEKKVLSKTT